MASELAVRPHNYAIIDFTNKVISSFDQQGMAKVYLQSILIYQHLLLYINYVTQYFSLTKPILYSGVTSPLVKCISVKTANKYESASESMDFQTRNKINIQIISGDLRKCDSKSFVTFHCGLNLISSGSFGKLIVVPKQLSGLSIHYSI